MKINITNLFELSKYLSTHSGQELRDALTYLADFVLIVVQALKGRLTYEDNLDVEIKNISIISGQPSVISSDPLKRVKELRIRRLIDVKYYIVDKYGWYYDNAGNIVLTCYIDQNPTTQVSADIIIIY